MPAVDRPIIPIFAAMSGYWTLLKPRLSLLVVLSTLLSYIYAMDEPVRISHMLLLGLFGFLITGAANIFNQVIEIELDAKMNRTRERPLPSQSMQARDASVYGIILVLTGVAGIGWCFNVNAAILSIVSFALYVFIYTPLKARTPLSVLVGAFPGALPILVGCVAASNAFYPDYFILFGIQFFWQFPHFWSIAWVLDEDYQKAGFRLLPFGRGKDSTAAYYIFLYTVAMLLVSLFPKFLHLVGNLYLWTAVVLGVGFLYVTIAHMRTLTDASARKVMFYSFFYLPLVQLLLAIDKI